MSWWIYKCNSQNRDYQISYGDWKEFFDGDSDEEWGSAELIPALSELKEGDIVIAYQTNRNELVGLAKVRQSCEVNGYLYLAPIEVIGLVALVAGLTFTFGGNLYVHRQAHFADAALMGWRLSLICGRVIAQCLITQRRCSRFLSVPGLSCSQ